MTGRLLSSQAAWSTGWLGKRRRRTQEKAAADAPAKTGKSESPRIIDRTAYRIIPGWFRSDLILKQGATSPPRSGRRPGRRRREAHGDV